LLLERLLDGRGGVLVAPVEFLSEFMLALRARLGEDVRASRLIELALRRKAGLFGGWVEADGLRAGELRWDGAF
jgi:hypothetical protein